MSGWPEALPERVRARVVSFAAQALPALAADHVPPALKRAVSFTPAKRARLAGSQIYELLASDPDFRERIAVQVRAQQPQAARDLAEQQHTVPAAALAVLEQEEGWSDLLDATTDAESARREQAEAEAAGIAVRRLRDQLAAAQVEAGERERSWKAEREELRRENADLRRKLGEARAGAREAVKGAEAAEHARVEAVEARQAEASAAEARVRRLRAQVEDLEAQLARHQRGARSERDHATVRARLLLDTLIQASEGLRRELGLPVTEGAPADQVAAEAAEQGHRRSSAAGSRRQDDPQRVHDVLALPQAHLIVDGYNVTRSVWESSSLEVQRNRLLAGIGPLAAQSGAEITVVFDGQHQAHRPMVRAPRGVRVAFSPEGVIADDLIREFVAAEPDGRVVGVVTNDQEIIRDVTRKPGVRAVPSEALVAALGR